LTADYFVAVALAGAAPAPNRCDRPPPTQSLSRMLTVVAASVSDALNTDTGFE
jgi:hypothetical protein